MEAPAPVTRPGSRPPLYPAGPQDRRPALGQSGRGTSSGVRVLTSSNVTESVRPRGGAVTAGGTMPGNTSWPWYAGAAFGVQSGVPGSTAPRGSVCSRHGKGQTRAPRLTSSALGGLPPSSICGWQGIISCIIVTILAWPAFRIAGYVLRPSALVDSRNAGAGSALMNIAFLSRPVARHRAHHDRCRAGRHDHRHPAGYRQPQDDSDQASPGTSSTTRLRPSSLTRPTLGHGS